jgi:hypothetical protein
MGVMKSNPELAATTKSLIAMAMQRFLFASVDVLLLL